MAWYYNNARGKPKKKTIISRKRAYHGVTIAAGSLTGLPYVCKTGLTYLQYPSYMSTPHMLIVIAKPVNPRKRFQQDWQQTSNKRFSNLSLIHI